MHKNCYVSAWTSAGAFVVATAPRALVGISYQGSANQTVINVFNGLSTAAAGKVACFDIPATAGGVINLAHPIACGTGIVATNVGTVASYAILLSTL